MQRGPTDPGRLGASGREAGVGRCSWESEGVHGRTLRGQRWGGKTCREREEPGRLREEDAARYEGQSRTVMAMEEGSRRGSEVTGARQ